MTRRDEPDIARLYHLHSANVRRRLPDLTVDHDRHPLRFRTYPGAQRLDLPGRDFNLTAPLGEALGERSSVRAFELQPLPLDLLGRLLHASYGLRRPGQLIGQGVAERPAPSAGGLYPLEIYVATHLVVDLPDAIYHYDPRSHALELRRPGLAQHQLAEMTIGQDMLLQANVVCIITAVFQRTMWKYGPRGYRYVWLDAGHVGQNLYLVTEALGLGSVAIGGFYDAEVNALLDLPADEEAIYLFGIGRTAAPHQEGGGS
jgi:SagB-type dehydrogenase family enzyme